jgi:dTDP-4-amino-4,6-dideoxygalactose transaminase
MDVGSSFLPSELNAAFLYAQLENLDKIQNQRKAIWEYYYNNLGFLQTQGVKLPDIPPYATNNGHLFYLVCPNLETRTNLLAYLRAADIEAIFHYLPLHASPYFSDKHDGRILKNADRFAECLFRLPLYFELQPEQQDYIIEHLKIFFAKRTENFFPAFSVAF